MQYCVSNSSPCVQDLLLPLQTEEFDSKTPHRHFQNINNKTINSHELLNKYRALDIMSSDIQFHISILTAAFSKWLIAQVV